METCKVLCSADCVHNSGMGYYNLCKHPARFNKPSYCGINRTYTSGCTLQQIEREVKDGGSQKPDQSKEAHQICFQTC